jgi:hypothetical protein
MDDPGTRIDPMGRARDELSFSADSLDGAGVITSIQPNSPAAPLGKTLCRAVGIRTHGIKVLDEEGIDAAGLSFLKT